MCVCVVNGKGGRGARFEVGWKGRRGWWFVRLCEDNLPVPLPVNVCFVVSQGCIYAYVCVRMRCEPRTLGKRQRLCTPPSRPCACDPLSERAKGDDTTIRRPGHHRKGESGRDTSVKARREASEHSPAAPQEARCESRCWRQAGQALSSV